MKCPDGENVAGIVLEVSWLISWSGNGVKSSSTIFTELHMLCNLLWSAVQIKEASWVVVDLCIPEVVEMILQLRLNEIKQLRGVLCTVLIELASC